MRAKAVIEKKVHPGTGEVASQTGRVANSRAAAMTVRRVKADAKRVESQKIRLATCQIQMMVLIPAQEKVRAAGAARRMARMIVRMVSGGEVSRIGRVVNNETDSFGT